MGVRLTQALALSVLVVGASAWGCADIKDVCARNGDNPSETRRFPNKCKAMQFKSQQPNRFAWKLYQCPEGVGEVLREQLGEAVGIDALAGAMAGGSPSASPMAGHNRARSPGNIHNQPGQSNSRPGWAKPPHSQTRAPSASAPKPFPKLDKKSCQKYIDMTNAGVDGPCDGRPSNSVCASDGVTYPSRCMLEVYICQRIVFPTAGKPAPSFVKDGECAGGMTTACYFPFIKCMNDKEDLKCVKINPTAPENKKNLLYQKNQCYVDMLKACALPNAQEAKLDQCKAAGSELPDSRGPKAPGTRVNSPSSSPMSTPVPKNDPKMDCLRMKCDPRAIKEEWCGSDGKTYTNRCQIMFDNCMKRAQGGALRAPSASGNGKPQGMVRPDHKGACAKKCAKASDCGANEACVGTCVPKALDKCAVKQCASGKKCKEVCDGKKSVTGKCMGKMVASCISTSVKASCDLTAMRNCYMEAVLANPNMSPCGKMVAQTTCAKDSECFNTARRLCNSGVLIQEDGRAKRYLPTNCAVPACSSNKIVDPKCKKANYQTCKDKIKNARSNCEGMEAAAKCVESWGCEEDITIMCYIAKNMLDCKGKDLNTVCKNTKTPIKPKEMSEADEELFGDHEFMTEGSGAPQSNFAVVGVVACAALLAVGLAAFLLRRRAAAQAQGPEADYQAV